MTFYTTEEAGNPTQRKKTHNIRQSAQPAEAGYAMETSVQDATIMGVSSRVLSSIETSADSQSAPLDASAQSKWTFSGVEKEFKDSLYDAREQFAVLINGGGTGVQRSPQAQAFYEQDVVEASSRVAHKNGASFRVQETDGAKYAVISRGDGKGVDTVKGAFVAYQATQAGMSQEQIAEKLTTYGYDEQDLLEINKRVAVINQAQAAGMSLSEVQKRMSGSEVVADTTSSAPTEAPEVTEPAMPTAKQKAFKALNDTTVAMTAEELVSSLKVLHPTLVSDTMTTIPAYFGNEEAKQRYDASRDASRTRIINLAKSDYNLDLVWQPKDVGDEGWFAQTEEGLVEVTPGFWEDFRKSTAELAGGIGGAMIGMRSGAALGAATALTLGQAGPQIGLPEELLTVPLLSFIGSVGGAAVGGWLGAVGGSQVDYMIEATKLQEGFEAEAMAHRALNAFEAAAIGEALGYPIVKGLGVGWKGIIQAKDAILGGELRAAYAALRDTTFLSEDQIATIVKNLEKHAEIPGNKYEKSIRAVALTEPGMQELVRAAGTTQPKASAATAHTVQARAEDVLARTSELTNEQVPRMLMDDLQNYTIDVKDQYAAVKARATQSPKGLNFKWDFEKLAISPVMEKLSSKITDPATKEKFLLQMRHINTMSENRNFGDLIELRQTVNDFLYNKRITKADDAATIRGVVNNIDKAIEEGASSVLEKPEQWLKDWRTARADYSKMKQVEQTAMYRAMFDKSGKMRAVQPESVVKALGKHITAIDGSFEDLMTKLPIAGRKLYEGAVIDSLAQRFTAGVDKGAKAIHFPLLSDELSKINFTTPDARATKQALLELGEVFKNDVWLAQTSGQVSVPKFQSYLTADPVVRMKFEAASGIFNYVKSKMPGDANKQFALVRATAKLLEKPLDVKNFKMLQAEVFDDANLSKQILELQQEAARNRAKEVDAGTPSVKVYPGGKLKGVGTSTSIPMHRIITLEQAREIAGTEALTLDSKTLDAVLIQYGYKAILQGSDRVRILKEN
jgi:hypothetical protein